MSMISMVGCATSDTTAQITAKVDDGPVRIAVADNAGMNGATFFGPESVDADGVATVSVTGLDASTRYHYQVEDDGVLDTGTNGQLLTYPAAGSEASYTFVASGDAGLSPTVPGATGNELAPDRISNHGIFDTIRSRALENDWLFFLHLGDLHYYDLGSDNHGIVGGGSLANYRTAYDDILDQPNQAGLMRDVSFVHVWDDHDFGPNNSDGDLPDKANAAQVFREREPHHDLGESDAIYRSFEVGRVLFVIWDERYYRSPNSDPDGPSKTMLGEDQKDWFENLLNTSDAEVLIVVSTVQWVVGSDGSDSWGGFATERQEIADLLVSTGWADRMVMLQADAHRLALDSGAINAWGGWPLAVFASLDAIPSSGTVGYDVLEQGGRAQYGTVTLTDLGSVITIRLTGWQNSTEVGSLQIGFTTSTAPPSFSGDMAELVYGSHRMTAEARVLTRFQTGDDPDGETIKIEDGSVTYDATAQVFASLELTTSGLDERRRSRFPRIASDLLAPYGHEVFVRRGVDIGSEIVWVPLGYFRLTDAEQGPDSDSPIRLSGQDRMSGIVAGELIVPRQYQPGQSVAAVVMDLVEDIYPSATIVFDDDSGQRDLGRQLLVEQDRYAALLDIAESLGKIMYWDGEGILRIEDAPDPEALVWDIRAGYHGVLIEADRRVSREGMVNAIVARGEGGDTRTPVQAIAIDNGPNSPTRWFPPDDPDELWFGQVPGYYSSPLLTTAAGAFSAAQKQLRRRIGLPYNIQFSTVVNPALRPREAVRVTQKSGDRERHLIETYTVPLTADQAADGTTREQTQIVISDIVPSALVADPGE